MGADMQPETPSPDARADDGGEGTPTSRRRSTGGRRRVPSRRRATTNDEASFDDFYLSSRRRVLMQSLAPTGDLDVSRSAVRDAYVAAYHHWRKVGQMADPESWVRPQAWGRAHRRSRVRPAHRPRAATEEQMQVLDGLSKLSDTQLRTLLLAHLAALP
ncbi:MAG TPA: hypothetical protein VF426_00930, partial [Marmoricola sp.]